jgi:hypothetical protein
VPTFASSSSAHAAQTAMPVCGCAACAQAARGHQLPDGPVAETVVSDYTALLSGRNWSGMGVSGTPVIVTYSFNSAAQPYLDFYGFSDEFIASFQAFSAGDMTMARNALAKWGNASGIVFIEVAAGQGDIQFGRFDFSHEQAMAGFDGYAFYPNVTLTAEHGGESGTGGDVFVNASSPNSVYLMLHEVGHALGLKHPFQGEPTIDPAHDDHAYTVMSYTGTYPNTLGLFDYDAVEHLYGLSDSDGTHVAAWSWDAAAATLTQTGTVGDDIIRGIYGKDVILGAGGNDILFGSFGFDVLSGGLGRDALFGSDDDDSIRGGRGQDLLNGELGSDVFHFAKVIESVGVKRDTIVGFDPLDADTINIKGRLHSVEADIDGGALSTSTFDADLEAAVTGPLLHKRAAVLFLPDSGNLAGRTFLIVEKNGDSGYQALADLVIELRDAVNLGSLDISDFI